MEVSKLRFSRVIRGTAHAAAASVSLFFLLFLISEGFAGLFEGKFAVMPLLLMMMYSVAGYLLVLLKKNAGIWMMISGGLIMALYLLIMGGIAGYKMALIFGLPFVIPGLMFHYFKRSIS